MLRRFLSLAVAAALALGMVVVGAASPAAAGAGLYIGIKNDLPPSATPGYPRITMHQKADFWCWYTNDLEDWGKSAGPGENVTLYTEVNEAFFSTCTISPNRVTKYLKWRQFGLYVQTEPGAAWQELTWSSDSTGLISYWKINMDPRGYHFDMSGPRAGVRLGGPLKDPVCVKYNPSPMLNYTSEYKLTFTGTGCAASSAGAPATTSRTKQARTAAVKVGQRRTAVVGQRTPNSSWRIDSCTTNNSRLGKIKEATINGQDVNTVVLRGKSVGTDKCAISLRSDGATVLKQVVTINVRA